MKTIDLETWPRRSQYAFFRELAQPHFSVCVDVDCTHLVESLKPAGVSPFNAVLWSLLAAANDVPELRTRFRNDTVVEHAVVHASATVPIGDDAFAFCSLPYDEDWSRFNGSCQAAIEAASQQDALAENTEGDGWLYLSCLPWFAFTAMTNPTRGADDCVPRITWGRFHTRDGRWRIPVAVQVHHALVDGLHLGRFFSGVNERLANLGVPSPPKPE